MITLTYHTSKSSLKKGDVMDIAIEKIVREPMGSPDELAMRIKENMPSLADLTSDQLEQIAKLVIVNRLTKDMDEAVNLADMNWEKQKETFLGDVGKRSEHTRRAYASALARFEEWAGRKKLNMFTMKHKDADDYIRFLDDGILAPASVRRDISAISAFYSWLERYSNVIKNPIRGTRLMPAKENKKTVVIPTVEDLETIMANVPDVERAIIATMSYRGLRAGALPTLVLENGRYYGKSKGKKLMEGDVEGITLPEFVLDIMKSVGKGDKKGVGLDMKRPFAWKTRQKTIMSAGAIESRVNKQLKRLYEEGKIKAVFSAHDFRHFFAVSEYEKSKDILRVSVLLGHANVAITQTYLRSLSVKV